MNKVKLLVLLYIISNVKSLVTPTTKTNDDWSVPGWVSLTSNSGFFSEEATSSLNINLPVFDIAWKQINPAKDTFSYTTTATVKDMPFSSFSSQNSTTKPFWMRIWNSGVDWAPTWIQSYCNVKGVATDYDGDSHLPIWDPCVWSQIKAMYTHIFKDLKMREDSRLKFIYVPGAFNWCEFDFTEISQYKQTNSSFTFNVFNAWFQTAMQDLADIFGEYRYKLVYTGEDYPFDVEDWPASKNLLAKDAVLKGMGIRNGITELFNFHLNEIPAYGVSIDKSTGYLYFNNSWNSNPNRIVGTENECFNDCGFTIPDSNNIYYAVKMSNLKALQMGVNWLYLVKKESYVEVYTEFYNWIRYSLGKKVSTSFDAWVVLRKAQDLFWNDDDSITWPDKPYIKNLEHFLIQRDSSGAQTKDGSVLKSNIYNSEGKDLGNAYEGRQTNIASNNMAISFNLDNEFAFGDCSGIQIKVTYLDLQASQFIIRYKNNLSSSLVDTAPAIISGTNSSQYYTATFNFDSITFNDSVSTRNSDFEIINTGAKDIEILFVRVIKLNSNSCLANNDSSLNSNSGNTSTSKSLSSEDNGSSSVNNSNRLSSTLSSFQISLIFVFLSLLYSF